MTVAVLQLASGSTVIIGTEQPDPWEPAGSEEACQLMDEPELEPIPLAVALLDASLKHPTAAEAFAATTLDPHDGHAR